ncbi:hypothetical protein WMF27_05205 [Sorangium sp. So ce281]|uniref:hypothetical protein n=1 Tax=unclassified Sorangium TaxID=2621164 RepID=UPI003F63A189
MRSAERLPVALASSGARYDSSSGFCPAVAESHSTNPERALSFTASLERAAAGFLQRWLSSQITTSNSAALPARARPFFDRILRRASGVTSKSLPSRS